MNPKPAGDRVLREKAYTWYGLSVEIEVSSNNWHRVKVGGLTLPHPGLVNFISRWAMPYKERLRLTQRHELGHLQVLPLPLLHLLLILRPRRGRDQHRRRLRWLTGLLANQAVWEIGAEMYTAVRSPRGYYLPQSRLGRGIYAGFWGLMLVVAVVGTHYARSGSPPSNQTQ